MSARASCTSAYRSVSAVVSATLAFMWSVLSESECVIQDLPGILRNQTRFACEHPIFEFSAWSEAI